MKDFEILSRTKSYRILLTRDFPKREGLIDQGPLKNTEVRMLERTKRIFCRWSDCECRQIQKKLQISYD